MGTPYLIHNDYLYNDFHDYVKTFGFDLADTGEIDSVIKKSLLKLEFRGLAYEPKMQTPYSGWFAEFYNDGSIKKLQKYSQGLLDGPLVEYKDDEDYPFNSACTYREGIKDGPAIMRATDCDLFDQGTFKNDKKHGTWLYNDNELLNYKCGELHGKASWESEGDNHAFQNATNLDHCKCFNYFWNYPNSVEFALIRYAGQYELGKEHGKWIYKLCSEDEDNGGLGNDLVSICGHYYKGVKHGFWGLFGGAGLIEGGEFDSGNKIGDWTSKESKYFDDLVENQDVFL